MTDDERARKLQRRSSHTDGVSRGSQREGQHDASKNEIAAPRPKIMEAEDGQLKDAEKMVT